MSIFNNTRVKWWTAALSTFLVPAHHLLAIGWSIYKVIQFSKEMILWNFLVIEIFSVEYALPGLSNACLCHGSPIIVVLIQPIKDFPLCQFCQLIFNNFNLEGVEIVIFFGFSGSFSPQNYHIWIRTE